MTDCAELTSPSAILAALKEGLPRWESDLDSPRSTFRLAAFIAGAPCLERLTRVGLALIFRRLPHAVSSDETTIEFLGLGESARVYERIAHRLHTPRGPVNWTVGVRALKQAAAIRNETVHGRRRNDVRVSVRSFLKRVDSFCASELASDLVALEGEGFDLSWPE